MGCTMSSCKRRKALPKELIFSEILPKLPAESLIRFKSVSKEWCDFIDKDATLKKSHARHQCLTESLNLGGEISIAKLETRTDKNDQKLVFRSAADLRRKIELGTPGDLKGLIFTDVASSYGLVLVSKPLMLLWNPVTGKFRVLPEPLAALKYCISASLWFDEESDDHKVVRISRNRVLDHDDWQVFSKRSGSWRNLQTIPTIIFPGSQLVLRDEALYFLASQDNNGGLRAMVMSFTYRSEEVRKVMNVPADCHLLPGKMFILANWEKDSLALLTRYPSSVVKRGVCDLWVMIKNEEDEGFRWFKLFAFDCFCDIRGVWSDRVLINNQNGTTEVAIWDNQCLVLNNPICFFGNVMPYVPTLLPVY